MNRTEPHPAPLDGVLLVDKSEGPTSHDVVGQVRRVLGQRRVGHAGTLDPFATGLLVIVLGRATRLARFLSGQEKTYEGVVRFGFATDTLDRTGAPEGEAVAADVPREVVDSALRSLEGELEQVPPMYSAKKVAGVPLHRLARRGVEVERPPARVRVGPWTVLGHDGVRLRFRVTVSAGTYVRSLAAELGRRAECPAHLEELRRVRSGGFSVEDAVDLDASTATEARQRVLSLDVLPDVLPAVVLDAEAVLPFRHGRAVHPAGGCSSALVFVRSPSGALLGVARRGEDGLLHPEVVLRPPC